MNKSRKTSVAFLLLSEVRCVTAYDVQVKKAKTKRFEETGFSSLSNIGYVLCMMLNVSFDAMPMCQTMYFPPDI